MGRGFVYPAGDEEALRRKEARLRSDVQAMRRGEAVPVGVGAPTTEAPPSVEERPDGPPAGSGADRRGEEADGYREKLLKYVPAEVLAFFVPASALVDADREELVLLIFFAGVVGTLLYLHLANRQVVPEQQAPWWNYGLAVAAFAVWALATSPATAALVNLDEQAVGVILAVGALLIPGADLLGTREGRQTGT